jgi:hypothetical protein
LFCLDQLAAEEQFLLPLVAVFRVLLHQELLLPTSYFCPPDVAMDKSGVKLLATNMIDVIPLSGLARHLT